MYILKIGGLLVHGGADGGVDVVHSRVVDARLHSDFNHLCVFPVESAFDLELGLVLDAHGLIHLEELDLLNVPVVVILSVQAAWH